MDAQSTVAAATAAPPMPSAVAMAAAADAPPSYSSLYPEIPRESGPMYPGVPQETSVRPQLAQRVRLGELGSAMRPRWLVDRSHHELGIS